MLASLSIDDDVAIKLVMVLGAVIAHLYWLSLRCRDQHETTKERLAALENKIAACPSDDCPLQKPGSIFDPFYCVRQDPKKL